MSEDGKKLLGLAGMAPKASESEESEVPDSEDEDSGGMTAMREFDVAKGSERLAAFKRLMTICK